MAEPKGGTAVTTESRGKRLISLLTLKQTRATLRSRAGRVIATGIAIVYGSIALFAGFMLQIGPTGASGTTVRILTNSYSPAWWNYPAVLVTAPGGILVLPFASTISMALVAIGVGVGMGAGILLAARFIRSWKQARGRGGLVSPLAGLTPAMVAALTLGACCSTSAAAAGSIGAIAAVSGTSYDQVLLNSWILNVFQVVVLAIALIAQEMLIGVYSDLLASGPEAHHGVTAMPHKFDGGLGRLDPSPGGTLASSGPGGVGIGGSRGGAL